MAAFRKLKSLLGTDVSRLVSRSLRGATPEEIQAQLHQAIEASDLALVDRALAAGADPFLCSAQGLTPVHMAVHAGNAPLLGRLLSGARVDLRVDEPSAQGHSALSDAAAAGHLACVHTLLEAGASASFKGPRGVRVLHRAAAQDNAEILRMLFKAGADWTVPDAEGRTPLDVLQAHRPQAVNAWRRHAGLS